MSEFVINQLLPNIPIEQKFRITESINIAGVRPYMMKHGTLQDGDFKLTLFEGAVELLSTTINYATINTEIPDTYAHGLMLFAFDDHITLNHSKENSFTEYTIKLEALNHTLDTDNYLTWNVSFNEPIVPVYGQGTERRTKDFELYIWR